MRQWLSGKSFSGWLLRREGLLSVAAITACDINSPDLASIDLPTPITEHWAGEGKGKADCLWVPLRGRKAGAGC